MHARYDMVWRLDGKMYKRVTERRGWELGYSKPDQINPHSFFQRSIPVYPSIHSFIHSFIPSFHQELVSLPTYITTTNHHHNVLPYHPHRRAGHLSHSLQLPGPWSPPHQALPRPHQPGPRRPRRRRARARCCCSARRARRLDQGGVHQVLFFHVSCLQEAVEIAGVWILLVGVLVCCVVFE
ncbi:hypothetical protein CC80DRAFT_118509 [Byssothecium circinans]|uniref:Uncharacterized protein n=1 Tax=Byssothecium circinans TaxID=147558 RepID=A0A6A5U128_9PLEO|nr:hypothetical protein CC80DRAFT_118509 [Byssothecium circinans]